MGHSRRRYAFAHWHCAVWLKGEGTRGREDDEDKDDGDHEDHEDEGQEDDEDKGTMKA